MVIIGSHGVYWYESILRSQWSPGDDVRHSQEVQTDMYLYIYIYVYLHVLIYTYIHIHTNAYVYFCMYTHIMICSGYDFYIFLHISTYIQKHHMKIHLKFMSHWRDSLAGDPKMWPTCECPSFFPLPGAACSPLSGITLPGMVRVGVIMIKDGTGI